MEQPRAVLTITENPVGDGIHTQLMLRCEIHPPLGPDEEPTMTHMAAMVAMDAITKTAEASGGGIHDVQTFESHDEAAPGWWGGLGS